VKALRLLQCRCDPCHTKPTSPKSDMKHLNVYKGSPFFTRRCKHCKYCNADLALCRCTAVGTVVIKDVPMVIEHSLTNNNNSEKRRMRKKHQETAGTITQMHDLFHVSPQERFFFLAPSNLFHCIIQEFILRTSPRKDKRTKIPFRTWREQPI